MADFKEQMIGDKIAGMGIKAGEASVGKIGGIVVSKPPPIVSNSFTEFVGNLSTKPIDFTEEPDQASEEAIKIGEILMKPALYDQLQLIVPRYPLQDVEQIEYDSELYVNKFLDDFNKWIYTWFLYILLTVYPFVVPCFQAVRFSGYLVYYFWAIPVRMIVVHILEPFLDGLWRICRPYFVFFIACFRPITAVTKDLSGAILKFYVLYKQAMK